MSNTPKTIIPTNYEAYMDGYMAGVKFCQKYDIPEFMPQVNSLNPDNKPYTGKEFIRQSKPMEEKDVICPPQKSDTGKDSKVDWEIVSFKQKSGITDLWTKFYNNFWCRNNRGVPITVGYTDEQILNNPLYSIHSVKRLSDNTVFSVGDAVFDMWEEGNHFSGTIIGFQLNFNDMLIEYGQHDKTMHLNNAKKYSPKPTPEKTVTDNSDVACLSLNDVMGIVRDLADNTNGYNNRGYLNSRLHELVTKKLKTHTP